MIKHYIITRFNYPVDYPHYLERIDHFYKYTVQSLLNQVNKNFTYIILSDTLPEFEPLKKLNYKMISFKTKSKVKDYDINSVNSFIKEDTTAEDIIITTRLDNDDVLLPKFTRNIQVIARHQTIPVLIELKGYWLDLRYFEKKFYRNERYNEKLISPFLSVVERSNKFFKTAYYTKHSEMWKHFNVVSSSCDGWIQILHNTNQLMNKLKIDQLGKEVNRNKFQSYLYED